ncbi:IS6 family transposase, partial [Enterococcus faecium]
MQQNQAPSITSAFKKLKEYGFYQGTEHRTIKYLNNLIEQDHRRSEERREGKESRCRWSPKHKKKKDIQGLKKKTRQETTHCGVSG